MRRAADMQVEQSLKRALHRQPDAKHEVVITFDPDEVSIGDLRRAGVELSDIGNADMGLACGALDAKAADKLGHYTGIESLSLDSEQEAL